MNARAEFLQQKVSDRLNDMAADPADYAQNEVWEYWHNIIPGLLKSATSLEGVLMPGNRDQAQLVAKIKGVAQELSGRAQKAMDAMNEFRSTHMPDKTAGEIYEENAEDIRKAASEDWEEGGWSYFGWSGNKIGLGANKLLHGMGNVATGFYMDTHAARAHAYRMGNTSYNDFTGFHPSISLKEQLAISRSRCLSSAKVSAREHRLCSDWRKGPPPPLSPKVCSADSHRTLQAQPRPTSPATPDPNYPCRNPNAVSRQLRSADLCHGSSQEHGAASSAEEQRS